MPRVVILGGGFAGLAAARELQRMRKRIRDLQIVLVDRNNFMAFTPLLPEAATGNVDFRAVTQPLRSLLPHVRVELGDVLSVDEDERNVHVRHPLTHASSAIAYDELVLALGSIPSFMGIEGADRFTVPLRTVSDAQRLRSMLVSALEVAAETHDAVERDRLLRFAIVGGGFTGVEAAGELTAFLRSTVRFYPMLAKERPQVVLIQGESRLLPHLPERYGKYAASVLSGRGVDIRINAKVTAVDGTGVTLESGKRFEARTILWDVGNEPAPFVKRLGLKLSKEHAILTERDFSIAGHPHMWAIGDCAAVPKAHGGTYAPLAQNATREGPLVARNVVARLRNWRTKPFDYKELGQMASLGNHHAIAELPGGMMVTGFSAWLLWRLYYLDRVPSPGRRTRVALDWALASTSNSAPVRLPPPEKTT